MTFNHERYAQEEVKFKSIDYQLIKRLLFYLFPYKLWVILAIGMLIISKAIEAWVPIQIGQIVQILLNAQGRDIQLFKEILSTSLIILGWISLTYLLDTLNILIKNWVGQKAILALRMQVYDHIERLPVVFFDHHPIGRLMTRTIHDVDQINLLFSESIIPLIGSLVLFVGIVIGIFILNWWIGLVLCLIFPFIWGLTHYFRSRQRHSYSLIRSIVSAMNIFVQEHLMGLHVIRTFGLHSVERQRFEAINRDHLYANLETVRHFALFFSGIEFLQNLAMISVFVLLIIMNPMEKNFQAGIFFTISLYSLMVFRPLFDLAERYNVLQSAMAAAERIFDILDTPAETRGPSPGLPLKGIETIEFKDVWFAYEKENWVLKGLSFQLRKGESMALIGTTGSGKTSVINLLLRFYEFQKGEILINGQEIHKYAVANLRGQFSLILQDPVIFSGSIYDNIALYESKIAPSQVQESADYVNLTPAIRRLPGGLQYVLTERGTSLSAGEMQLISLARAIAHPRSVLIFDEATSNIDVQTEKNIYDTLQKILINRTALVIAHRLSTIKNVTRILVLSKGVVAESGTHPQLLEVKGIYEKLYRLQSADFYFDETEH